MGRKREEVGIGGAGGKRKDEPIDADAESARWRHAVFEGSDEILVEHLSLLVAARARLHLGLEAGELVARVGQLRKRVGDFPAVDVGLEAPDQARIASAMPLG